MNIIPPREEVERLAAEEGLVCLGVAPLDAKEDYARFSEWLGEGRHAGMEWLEKYRECREEPARLLPGARNAIVIALPYDQGDSRHWENSAPRAAQYARFPDYHKILRRKGERLARRLPLAEGAFRVAVDTAPLLERALAAKTSRGFIGKNTCFIHPERGSFLLLGEILTTLPFVIDDKAPVDPAKRTEAGGCGTCDLCQVKCPTGALARDYTIESELCLSYWTIENRGTIPEKFWPWLAKYWYGCDICQLACPYNWRASGNRLPDDVPRREMPPLFDVAVMSQAEYEKYFGGTPMTRAKRGGLRRNALIALAVTRDPRLAEAREAARRDPEPPLPETLFQVERYLAEYAG